MTLSAIAQYLAKLERRSALPPRDRDSFLTLPGFYRDYAANQTIVAGDAPSTHCVIVETGFVSRARTLGDGARQIVAFHLPGDAVDLQSLLFTKTDHEIQSHAPTRTFWIAHDEIFALTERNQTIAKALWQDTLVDAAIFREWTANVGQRRARERIAHLFLELAARYEAIGMLDADTFDLPVTQSALAESLGLSLVHLNKSLQSLRREGYFSTGHNVKLERKADLIALAKFDGSYLHLNGSRTVDPKTRATVASLVRSIPSL